MKKILLVCGAGMSTSLLVTKMKEVAKQRGIDVEIDAASFSTIDSEITGADVLLLGPQVSFRKDDYIKKYGDKVPIDVIDHVDYGMMNGEKVLDQALKIMKDKES